LVISLSHGAEWKALISKYIGTIPVNGDALVAAEHSIPGMPTSWIPVTSAMIAKIGAAASDSKRSALALGHSRRCPTFGWTKWIVLEIISLALMVRLLRIGAFSGKVDTGFPQENATNKGQLERFPIQRNRKAL
jgi:hypothetical protein